MAGPVGAGRNHDTERGGQPGEDKTGTDTLGKESPPKIPYVQAQLHQLAAERVEITDEVPAT